MSRVIIRAFSVQIDCYNFFQDIYHRMNSGSSDENINLLNLEQNTRGPLEYLFNLVLFHKPSHGISFCYFYLKNNFTSLFNSALFKYVLCVIL